MTEDMFDPRMSGDLHDPEVSRKPRVKVAKVVRDYGTEPDQADIFAGKNPLVVDSGTLVAYNSSQEPSGASPGAAKDEAMSDPVPHPVDGRDLASPDTYASDPEIAALARRLAAQHYEELGRGRVGLGDLKREFTAGKHAAIVAAALTPKKARRVAKVDPESLVPPTGYTIEVKPDEILLRGPFDDDLHARIKRSGGYWDGTTGKNRKLWVIPPGKAASLKKVLANWAGAKPGRAEEAVKKAAAESARRERDEAVRWLGYVEENAGQYLYKKGVEKLEGMGIGKWPDLKERLDAAVARAKAAKAAKAAEANKNPRTAYGGSNSGSGAGSTQSAPKQRRLYLVSRQPRLNVPVMLGGKLVVFTGHGEQFRIHEDDASIHGPHLLGHEGEYGAYSYYRDATEDEKAAWESAEVVRVERLGAVQAAEKAVRAAAIKVREAGEYVPGMNVVEGERLLNTQKIYGGGDWWIIQPEWIWYIQNNGADGDDWSRNNVRTGGAGAIGYRIPRTKEIESAIRAADKVLMTKSSSTLVLFRADH